MHSESVVSLSDSFNARMRDLPRDAEDFVPQRKEGITDARWVPLEEAIEMVHFKALKRLLKEARRQIRDN